MAQLVCTSRLEGIGPVEPAGYPVSTVGDLLDTAAADFPRLKRYVLDDQGRVRKHVAVFVNGTLHKRDSVLDWPLDGADEVYVMQALSGG